MEFRALILGLSLTASLSAAGTCAYANDEGGFYAGSGAGLYYLDFDGIDFDESAASLRLFGGYELNRYVSFEAGFSKLFESSGEVLGTGIDIDGTAWDVSVRPTLPLGDRASAFGILGWTNYDFDISVSAPGLTASDSEKDDDLMYGIGAAFDVTDNWSLRGEWVTVDVSDADFGMFSVAATYRFR